MINNKNELLAPAGSMDSLIAAVKSGADAVYLGGSFFSARQSAANFNDEQLIEAIDYCHLFGVKIYVAVNIIISDREFDELTNFILFINKSGADGVIVADLGVAAHIRNIAPDLPLHASTQMTVYDKYGAKLLEQLGFKRVVLARELSAQKIKDICDNTKLETEIFVHGAICVSYSGQCLMSSIIGGRSGNRGRCAQPCRLLYTIENKTGYLLSPKDLCLVNYINELSEIGVKSFKIEGRMKGAEYVSKVVSTYRKYLDSKQKISKSDYEDLEKIFFRGGFTDGYYKGEKGKDMFCHTKPDNPYAKQDNSFNYIDVSKKIYIDIHCTVQLGKPICLKITDENGNEIIYNGKYAAETAINVPLTHERLKQQLSKLGGSSFALKNLSIEAEDNISVPISEINDARRSASDMLAEKITGSYKRENSNFVFNMDLKPKAVKQFAFTVQVSTLEQLETALNFNFANIYIPLELAVSAKSFTDDMVVVLPRISHEGLEETLRTLTIRRALATNIGQIYMLNKLGFEILIDHSLNIFNQMAVLNMEKLGASVVCLSTELMLSQIKCMASKIPLEVVIYGRLPLMITENCIVKSSVGCRKNNKNFVTDRTGEKFEIKCLANCTNEIINSKPVVMSDKLTDMKNSCISFGRLIFTNENKSECKKIINAYKLGSALDIDFTRGKFIKGVQ